MERGQPAVIFAHSSTHPEPRMPSPDPRTFDLFVHNATPGGIAAAVNAARLGAKVGLLEPTGLVGGLSTNGIGTAESEHMLDPSFSGFPMEFYGRLGRFMGHDFPALFWHPKDALTLFETMLDEAGVTVLRQGDLDEVETSGGRIRSVTVDGARIEARVFIDASYEGDLMAMAGVSYTWGREARSQYGESLAGMCFIHRPEDAAGGMPGTQDKHADDVWAASPYDDDGNLLPFFTPLEEIREGEGDRKVMNYNFRLTLTENPAHQAPLPKPAGYDPGRFLVLSRFLHRYPETRLKDLVAFLTHPSGNYVPRENSAWRMRTAQGDTCEINNRQAAIISLGHFGGQFGWPDGTRAERQAIWDDHVNYTQGLLWFLAHEPDTPAPIREAMARYGLDARLYPDHGHWPHRLYVREARRMVNDAVLTQRDILEDRVKPDAVVVGSHWIDCHHVQRVAVDRDHFRNEGRMWKETFDPFQLPYACMVPRGEECANLLVPGAVAASHVAFTAIRLECTWMSLGQAAGTAAALALAGSGEVQSVPVGKLQADLTRQGVILDPSAWSLPPMPPA